MTARNLFPRKNKIDRFCPVKPANSSWKFVLIDSIVIPRGALELPFDGYYMFGVKTKTPRKVSSIAAFYPYILKSRYTSIIQITGIPFLFHFRVLFDGFFDMCFCELVCRSGNPSDNAPFKHKIFAPSKKIFQKTSIKFQLFH